MRLSLFKRKPPDNRTLAFIVFRTVAYGGERG
jgi:hypothetical protein